MKKGKSTKAVPAPPEPEEFTISMGSLSLCILGRSPLLINAMSQKIKFDQLQPPLPKTKTQRRSVMKHYPLEEFRSCVYRDTRADGPTRLQALTVWFKKGIASMALDLPSAATKAQLGRCVFVDGERVPLYGRPFVHMGIVRMAGIGQAPDVRTRAILPQWACRITVQYMRPALTEKVVMQLIAAAGLFRGVGEWRPERGSGAFGQYAVVAESHPEFQAVLAQGRAVQDAVLTVDPLQAEHFYDHDSYDLYVRWLDEAKRREHMQQQGAVVSNGELETEEGLDEVLT